MVDNALNIFIPICNSPCVAFVFIVCCPVRKLWLDNTLCVLVFVGVSFAWIFVETSGWEQLLFVLISMGISAAPVTKLNRRSTLEMSFNTGTPTFMNTRHVFESVDTIYLL
jgi:hypothetical protein